VIYLLFQTCMGLQMNQPKTRTWPSSKRLEFTFSQGLHLKRISWTQEDHTWCKQKTKSIIQQEMKSKGRCTLWLGGFHIPNRTPEWSIQKFGINIPHLYSILPVDGSNVNHRRFHLRSWEASQLCGLVQNHSADASFEVYVQGT
jgi:hypothetical protein